MRSQLSHEIEDGVAILVLVWVVTILTHAPLSIGETLHLFGFGFFFDPSLPTSAALLYDLVSQTVNSVGEGRTFLGFAGFCAHGVASFDASLRSGMPELLHLANLEHECQSFRTAFAWGFCAQLLGVACLSR